MKQHVLPSPFDVPTSLLPMATLLLVSPIVIGTRMSQFWTSPPTFPWARNIEASTMVTEKVFATGESMIAVGAATAEVMTETVCAMMTGKARFANDLDTILTAGLTPYAERVAANQQRLTKG